MTAPGPVPGLPVTGFRRRAFDRVGGSRLTGLGSLLLFALLFLLFSPPSISDRTVMSVLLVAAGGFFVIGVAWPLVAVRQVGVEAATARDATVGDQVPLRVSLSGRSAGLEVRALDPTGPWHRATAPSSGSMLHLADRRGVFVQVRVEVRVTGALGILAAHRVHLLGLGAPIEVAPKPLAVHWAPAPAPLEVGTEAPATGVAGVDLVRTVRPYTPGDPARLVHWPTTARSGVLVIREMEPPGPVGQAIVVDLRGLGEHRERAASYGLGAARAVLAAGGLLVLCTHEARGPVTAPVSSPLEAGRRLARAVPGPPGEPPEGWPVVEIGQALA